MSSTLVLPHERKIRRLDVLFATLSDEPHELYDAEPPVSEAFDLGDGLWLGPLPAAIVDAVWEECVLPGRRFLGSTPFAHAFYRDPSERFPTQWDGDMNIEVAVALSRLVRGTGIDYEFAAQVRLDENDKVVEVIPAHMFPGVLEVFGIDGQARRWLSVADGALLRDLISAYNGLGDGFPTTSRLSHAMWYFTQSPYIQDPNIRMTFLVALLEGLFSTETLRANAQFRERLIAVSREVRGPTLDRRFADEVYKLRSTPAHGGRLVLHMPRYDNRETFEKDINDKLIVLEEIARLILRRALFDRDFRETLQDPVRVAARWPVATQACPICQSTTYPDAVPVRCPHCQREWTNDGDQAVM